MTFVPVITWILWTVRKGEHANKPNVSATVIAEESDLKLNSILERIRSGYTAVSVMHLVLCCPYSCKKLAVVFLRCHKGALLLLLLSVSLAQLHRSIRRGKTGHTSFNFSASAKSSGDGKANSGLKVPECSACVRQSAMYEMTRVEFNIDVRTVISSDLYSNLSNPTAMIVTWSESFPLT